MQELAKFEVHSIPITATLMTSLEFSLSRKQVSLPLP